MTPLEHIPPTIQRARDYEFLARQFLATSTYEYIAGGSGADLTLAANALAFSEFRPWPSVLADVSHGHTRLKLLGQPFEHPVLLAPVAYLSLAHEGAELLTARAAAATDTGLVCSTLSSTALEDVAGLAGPRKWFQLYQQPRREDTLDLLRRAERAGYEAVVLTLDAAVQLPSLRALRAGFRMPDHVRPVNLSSYPVSAAPPPATGGSRIFHGFMAAAPSFADLDWLIRESAVPVLVKGVLRPDDALRLRDHGVAGLVVSNHGGRTLDGVPASLSVLPAIRQALGTAYPVLLDSGIRSGVDIFKAMALGASAVMIGRLQVYALAVAGALGVAHMLKLLREELELCMAVCGCACLADIRPESLYSERMRHVDSH